MMERKERKPYWRNTKLQIGLSLIPFLAALIVVPLYAGALNDMSFLGFPLGYFLTGHALLLLALFTAANFVTRQDAIDHWHGANEDA